MVVVDPRRPPGRTDSLAGSIDLGPTLLELADLRLTRHSDGSEQLFDMATDPDEMAPLGRTDPARRAEMYERLAAALMEAADLARGMPLSAA